MPLTSLPCEQHIDILCWARFLTRCRYISRNDDSIAQGDLASKVRRDEERRALANGVSQFFPHQMCSGLTLIAGVFVAPFLVAKKDCELFIKWKGDAGGLNHIRGEKVCDASFS
jgi:hypothetical protein